MMHVEGVDAATINGGAEQLQTSQTVSAPLRRYWYQL